MTTTGQKAAALARVLDADALNMAVYIVWGLASEYPPTDPEMGDCVLCNGSRRPMEALENHDETCSWREAMEFCNNHNLPASFAELKSLLGGLGE